MRLLIVEDDPMVASALCDRVCAAVVGVEIWTAETLEQAAQIVDSQALDAAIVDLRIPSIEGAIPQIEHGKAVEAHISRVQPGAFRVFLTAYEAYEVVQALQLGKTDDFLSEGHAFCMVHYVLKDGTSALDGCVDLLRQHCDRLNALDAVPLDGASDVDVDTRRALAVTVRSAGGTQGRVVKQGGLSGAATALVECFDAHGAVVGNAFCKTGSHADMERERLGYEAARYRLASTAMPSLARILEVGIGRSRGLIFTQAPTSTSFFDLVAEHPERISDFVSELSVILAPWMTDARREVFELSTLAREATPLVVREGFEAELAALDWSHLDGMASELSIYHQHGDLHGRNLFITHQATPFLIDFALTGLLHGPVDPVSLELSMLFHPESPAFDIVDDEVCDRWFDDAFIASVPFVGVVAVPARNWADAVSVTPGRDRAIATLEYALWVLKVAARPQHALAIASAALAQLRD